MSIAETDEQNEGSEPTMSALLRREGFTASPTPVSPNASYLGVRPAIARTPSASSTLRLHKKSEPTTPTITEPVNQGTQRPMSMPDIQLPEPEQSEEGETTIKVQKPTP